MESLTSNILVRKISYNNENELYNEVVERMTCHNSLFKLNSIVPLNETSAFIIMESDYNKLVVEFKDITEYGNDDSEYEVFPDAPNGDNVIMSIEEISLLEKLKTISVCDDEYIIDKMEMNFDSSSVRKMVVFIKKIED